MRSEGRGLATDWFLPPFYAFYGASTLEKGAKNSRSIWGDSNTSEPLRTALRG